MPRRKRACPLHPLGWSIGWRISHPDIRRGGIHAARQRRVAYQTNGRPMVAPTHILFVVLAMNWRAGYIPPDAHKKAGGRCLTSGGLCRSATTEGRYRQTSRGHWCCARRMYRCICSPQVCPGGLRCSSKQKNPAPRQRRGAGVQGFNPCRGAGDDPLPGSRGGTPGYLAYSAAWVPAMRPKTTMSETALPPRRLAPCTPPVTSPAA